MTAYERQIPATEQYYDRRIKDVEAQEGEVPSSAASGSRLHRLINNPYDEG